MKKIPKKQIDEIIGLTRDYWKTGATDLLYKRILKAQNLGKQIGVDWLAILNLLDGIMSSTGFEHDAENDEIYSVLRILGWECQ